MAGERSFDYDWNEHSPHGSRHTGKSYKMTTHPTTKEVVYKQLSPDEEQQRKNEQIQWEQNRSRGKGDAWWPDAEERLKVLEVEMKLRDPNTDQIKYFMVPGGFNGPVIKISKT
jgi:hypothetical protein